MVPSFHMLRHQENGLQIASLARQVRMRRLLHIAALSIVFLLIFVKSNYFLAVLKLIVFTQNCHEEASSL